MKPKLKFVHRDGYDRLVWRLEGSTFYYRGNVQVNEGDTIAIPAYVLGPQWVKDEATQ